MASGWVVARLDGPATAEESGFATVRAEGRVAVEETEYMLGSDSTGDITDAPLCSTVGFTGTGVPRG